MPEDVRDGIETYVSERSWQFFNTRVPRSQIVFVVQITFIFLLSTACIVNIILSETCEESTAWIAILTSLVGYVLPSPRP